MCRISDMWPCGGCDPQVEYHRASVYVLVFNCWWFFPSGTLQDTFWVESSNSALAWILHAYVYSAYSSRLLLSSFDDQPRAMSTACINLKNYRISLVSNSLGGISYLALGFSFNNQWLLLGTISIHGQYASVQTFLFLITFKIGLWNKIICFYASFNIFLVLLSPSPCQVLPFLLVITAILSL